MPDQVSINIVKPGSTWLKGFPWMQGYIQQAKLEGIIKSVEDIKLNNENKKIVKERIMFDSKRREVRTKRTARKGRK